MDWNKVIDAAHDANEKHGKEITKGKKYTEVSIRLELLRRHFGGEYGIETQLIEAGRSNGEWIIMRAVIRDKTGFVVASGTAQEVIGQGNVNRTSAIENCETSAIGRALAVLGLHGGEMASLNEMEGVPRKAATQDQAAQPQPEPPAFDPADSRTRMIAAVAKQHDQEGITKLTTDKHWQSAFGKLPPPMQLEVTAAVNARKQSIHKQDEHEFQ